MDKSYYTIIFVYSGETVANTREHVKDYTVTDNALMIRYAKSLEYIMLKDLKSFMITEK